jgi:hypothetical protein
MVASIYPPFSMDFIVRSVTILLLSLSFAQSSKNVVSGNLFRRCSRGGLCGLFLSLMHRGTPGTSDCREFCARFPILHSDLSCGECGAVPVPPSGNVTVSNETYGITLNLQGIPSSDETVFRNAAARWEGIITEGLANISTARFPPVADGCRYPDVIDDLFICASYNTIDGLGGILGQAGPVRVRTSNGLPIVGTMLFETVDVPTLRSGEAYGPFLDTIVHEMGHVLGECRLSGDWKQWMPI